MEYLIIDGYNVINSWSHILNLEKSTLEECRDKLLHYLTNFQGYKKLNIIVVFDAHQVKGRKENIDSFDNLTIVFTKENETADNYIEKFVHRNGGTDTIRVVTSDYLEQTIVLSKGGIRVTPKELWAEIETSDKNSRKTHIWEKHAKTDTIMSRLEPELLEKLEKMRRDKF